MPNWKKVITSGSDAVLNSLNIISAFTASGLTYPSSDNGEFSFLQSDGNGNLTLQYVDTMYEVVYNDTVSQIPKGTPLYVSGSQGSNSKVYPADASDPTKMPVIYVAADNIDPASTGRGILLGLITGVDTTSYPPGTEIYVASGGGWTSTRPTGSAIIQILGIVTKEGNGGQGVVLNPGPATLPNLTTGYTWVGDSDSYPSEVAISSFRTGSFTGSFVGDGSGLINLPGGGSFSGVTNFVSKFDTTTTISTGSIKDEGESGQVNIFISGSGNVGIGTSTPTSKLEIAGTLLVSSSLFQWAENTDVDTGTETVVSVATGSYRSAFFDYVIAKSTNSRCGTVLAVWNGSNIEYTETSTNDIGSTSDVKLIANLSGGDVRLQAEVISNDWSIKALTRLL